MKRKIILALIIILAVINTDCNKEKKTRYRMQFTPNKKTVFLVQAKKPTEAIQMIQQLFQRLSNPVEAVIFISATPDSFPATDPNEQRIKYFCVATESAAVAKVAELYQDTTWSNALERPLFLNFHPDSLMDKRLRRLDSLQIISGRAVL